MNVERWSLGRMQNPVRGFLHGGAAVAALVTGFILVLYAPTWPMRAAVAVFALAAVGLYVTSSLYHSIPWSEMGKVRMQRVDHSMIYVLIAGTYTPALFVVLDSPWRWVALGVAWGIVSFGVVRQLFHRGNKQAFSVALSTTLGWLGVFLVWPFIVELGWLAFALIVLGGALYTIGMVFMVTNRPRLWPRVFSYHEVFHVMVVLATITHFVVLARYVVPMA